MNKNVFKNFIGFKLENIVYFQVHIKFLNFYGINFLRAPPSSKNTIGGVDYEVYLKYIHKYYFCTSLKNSSSL